MKNILPFVFTLTFLLLFPQEIQASIVKIDSDGRATLKVLSYQSGEDGKNSLEITRATENYSGNLAIVSLSKTGDEKYNLSVNSEGVSRNLNVENIGEEIVEIEERPEIKKMTIGILDNKFALKQKEITALTEYPLTVNSETAEMSVNTEEGERKLKVFPHDAVETLTRSKLITVVKDNRIEILEEDGKLVYKVEGEKIIPILNIYNYKVPITTKISATSGEIFAIDTPNWLKFINLFFS